MNQVKTKIKGYFNSKVFESNSFYLDEQTPGVAKIYHSLFLKLVNYILESKEANLDFKVGRFIRIFIYHLLFFYIGPFVVPIVMIFDSIGLAANMGFWYNTQITGSLINQTTSFVLIAYMYTMWFVNFFALGKFEFTDNGPYLTGIYFEQFLFFSLHLVIRSFIIAVRYGSCSDFRFSFLLTDSQTADFVSKDYLVNGWLNFDPEGGLLSEINSSLSRNEVESSNFTLFKYNLIETLAPEN